MSYKLWIVIEDYDDETEHGEDCGPLDIGCAGTFEDYEAAEVFARRAHEAVKDAPGWTE